MVKSFQSALGGGVSGCCTLLPASLESKVGLVSHISTCAHAHTMHMHAWTHRPQRTPKLVGLFASSIWRVCGPFTNLRLQEAGLGKTPHS